MEQGFFMIDAQGPVEIFNLYARKVRYVRNENCLGCPGCDAPPGFHRPLLCEENAPRPAAAFRYHGSGNARGRCVHWLSEAPPRVTRRVLFVCEVRSTQGWLHFNFFQPREPDLIGL